MFNVFVRKKDVTNLVDVKKVEYKNLIEAFAVVYVDGTKQKNYKQRQEKPNKLKNNKIDLFLYYTKLKEKKERPSEKPTYVEFLKHPIHNITWAIWYCLRL